MGRLRQRNDLLRGVPDGVTVTVEAFVQLGDSVLLLRRSKDLWSLPGGARQLGESLGQTATRSVYEQTGLAVDIAGVVGIYTDPADPDPGAGMQHGRHLAICVRACPCNRPDLRTDIQRLRWAALTELDDLPLHATTRLRIGHALLHRKEPFIEPGRFPASRRHVRARR